MNVFGQSGADVARSKSRDLGSVALVVLNWNSWSNTVECLESLQRLTYPDCRILVVDNGSTDDSVRKIKSWAQGEIQVESDFFEYDPGTKPVQVVEYDRATAEVGGTPEVEAGIERLSARQCLVLVHCMENLGIAGGYNVGIRYALSRDFDYVWVMNNDVVVASECIELCVSGFEGHEEAGAIGAKILDYHNPQRISHISGKLALWLGRAALSGQGETDSASSSGIRRTDFVSGCALLIAQSAFEQLGLFDEGCFIIHEDLDWSCRLRDHPSYSAFINLDARVWHKEGGVSASGGVSPTSAYFANRNRFRVVFGHGSWLDRWLFTGFYCVTRPAKFLRLLMAGRRNLIQAELKGVLDFAREETRSFSRHRTGVENAR